MRKKNLDNLRSLADLPPERRQEIARMGGVASGQKRRKLACMKKSARRWEKVLAEAREKQKKQAARTKSHTP